MKELALHTSAPTVNGEDNTRCISVTKYENSSVVLAAM